MEGHIYKICSQQAWDAALATGTYDGSEVDLADGFIHFSTAAQVAETARKHFKGQTDLVIVAIDPAKLPESKLKWEPSRGGALFPHLYAPLPVSAASWLDKLVWTDKAGHILPVRLAKISSDT